jgi:membrane protease YdiL (CAAX protease family)
MSSSFINKYLILANRLSVSSRFMFFWLGLFLFLAYVQKDLFSYYTDSFTEYFEWIFALLSVAIFWQELKLKIKLNAFFFIHLTLSVVSGLLIYFLTLKLNYATPYELGSFWSLTKIIVIGPLIHELIFRFSLWVPLKRILHNNVKYLIVLSSLIYSFDMLNSIFYRPQSMHGFIYFQSVYTFFLAAWWAWSYIKKNSLLMPILMHIGFNFGFYFGSRLFL